MDFIGRHLWNSARCALEQKKGATTVELALILPVFLLILLATMEISLFYLNAVILEGAVREATRMIRTGQAQSGGSAETVFRTALCDAVFQLLNCQSFSINVQSAGSFAQLNLAPVFDPGGAVTNQNFSAGSAKDAIVASVGYRWKFITPIVGSVLGDAETNSISMVSTAVFRNEPFPTDN